MTRSKQSRDRKPAPRLLTQLEEAILREGERKITVRQDGSAVEMQINEIIIRKIAETAAKGSPHAQRLWTETHGAAERQRRARIDEEIAFWRIYQHRASSQIEAARQAGTPIPEPLPHPDDLEFDDRIGVRFTGPVTAEDVKITGETIRRRDLLLLQDALDAQTLQEDHGRGAEAVPSSAHLLAVLANQSLPKRLQLSDSEMISRLMEARGMSKRDLLKVLHQGWKKEGAGLPRGTTLPTIEDTRASLELLGAILVELRARPTLREADYRNAARDLLTGARHR
jgi:hypothetical protein